MHFISWVWKISYKRERLAQELWAKAPSCWKQHSVRPVHLLIWEKCPQFDSLWLRAVILLKYHGTTTTRAGPAHQTDTSSLCNSCSLIYFGLFMPQMVVLWGFGIPEPWRYIHQNQWNIRNWNLTKCCPWTTENWKFVDKCLAVLTAVHFLSCI